MSRIKFIEAEFHNVEKDRRAIRQRLERFLKERRALERGVVPPEPEDPEDALQWETDLMQVRIEREVQDRIDRRVNRLAERRDAAAGLAHLKREDRRALEGYATG
ncbi:cytochrome P450 [Leisingera daeponensis]|uniref:cytochrome P450 n=1 Tax=Leisingera daeponensis TaxID=405746 RepID=UPI001C9686AD|nr:cytochrome P450 [Leisingera daeponensis]MBY6057871.1 cytochrome P450 [Leisingera daeponensis]